MKEWTIAAVAKAQTGDPAALDKLLRGLLPFARSIAHYEQRRSRLSDRDHTFAEAAASHALVKLCEQLPSITVLESSGLSAWLHTVIRNYFIDQTRWNKSRTEMPTDETWVFEAEPHLDNYFLDPQKSSPTDSRLDAVLAKLKPEELDLLNMRFVGKMTKAELAEILGTSQGTVQQRIIRALKKARRLLEQAGYSAKA